MFRTMDLFNTYVILLLFSSLAGMTSATPVFEKRQLAPAPTATSRVQSLVPLDPSQPLNPALVDLLDQYDNLQQQADSLAEGSPNQAKAVQVASIAKQRLEANISGVASLSDGPAPTPTPYIPEPPAADPTTVTVAPSPTGRPKAPVLTIVTHLGTSAVVVASQGRTSTVVLDPISGATKTGARVGATPASNAAKNGASSVSRASVLSSVTVSVTALGLLFVL